MPATNKTAYLNLSQYLGSDSRKMTDYNSDMLKIDNQFVALRDGTNNTRVAIATLASKADTIQKLDSSYAAAGTAAFLNVPGTVGVQAGITEIVRGDDPRLTNERTPSNGSVTDTKIGNRTLDASTMPTSDVGTLTTILGWFAAMFAAITGGASWRTVPVATLASLNAKFDASSGHTHTGTVGDGPQIPAGGIANGAATDAKIGNRTIGDTTAPTSDSATISTLLSNFGFLLKQIKGGDSWRAAPVATIASLNGKFDAAGGHTHTGITGDAPVLGSNALAAGAATDAVIGNRTVSDSTAPTNNAGLLTTILSGIVTLIKNITGESTWRSVPADTLKTLRYDLDTHVHDITDVTGLQTALNGKAAVSHTHTQLAALQISGNLAAETLGVANVFISAGTAFPTGSPDGSLLFQYQ